MLDRLKIKHAQKCLTYYPPPVAIIAGLLIVLLGVVVTGCGRSETPPTYNRLRAQLIMDLCTALESNNPQAALNATDRLSPLAPQAPFLELIQHRENARLILEKANDLLVKGKPQKAMRHLEQQPQLEQRAPQQARLMQKTIHEIAALHRYVRQQPYTNAQQALNALAALTQENQMLLNVEHFRKWAGQQETRLVSKRADEIVNSIAQLYENGISDYSAARKKCREEIAEFQAQHPDHVLAKIWQGLESNRFKWDALVKQAVGEDDVKRVISTVISLNWSELTSTQIREIYALIHDSDCTTAVEWRTKALIAANRNHQSQALKAVQRMLETGGAVDPQMVRIMMERVVMAPTQFKARPWRTPLPQINDIFDILTQLKEGPSK